VSAAVRAVLWDFGGVILESPFDAFARYEQEFGLARLAEVFYRFKPLFLALRTNSQFCLTSKSFLRRTIWRSSQTRCWSMPRSGCFIKIR